MNQILKARMWTWGGKSGHSGSNRMESGESEPVWRRVSGSMWPALGNGGCRSWSLGGHPLASSRAGERGAGLHVTDGSPGGCGRWLLPLCWRACRATPRRRSTVSAPTNCRPMSRQNSVLRPSRRHHSQGPESRNCPRGHPQTAGGGGDQNGSTR